MYVYKPLLRIVRHIASTQPQPHPHTGDGGYGRELKNLFVYNIEI